MRAVFSNKDEFDKRPHRKWILETMVPTIANARPERIVFVGCAPYTFHYEKVFRRSGTNYITIDPHPSARVWGSDHHIVDVVERLPHYLSPHSVDCLIMIGVFGFGPDTEEDLHQVLEAIHSVLKHDGVLVFSWNNDLSPDPINHPDFRRLFKHGGVPGMPDRKTFDTTLVLDFYHAV